MAMRVLLSSVLLVCFIFVLALNVGAFDESVILYLSFDGQNAKKAIDQTGNGNDGILKGNVKWVKNGKVNGAVSFDRSAGTFVEIPDNKVLDSLTQSTTMEAWVKTNVATGGFGDDQILGKYANPKPNETTIMFISKMDYAAGAGGAKANGFAFETSPTSGWDGSSYVVGSKTLPKQGKWYHVAGTFDHKAGMLKIYIDGKLDGQRDINANKIGTNDQPFCIGGNAGNSNRWFDGMIDEVIVYNRALTEAEIKKDMEGLSVDLGHKTAVTWGSIKRQY